MKKKGIFTVKEKIGYGISSLGDTVVYNLLLFYGLYFMTDVVGLDPLKAGNVVFIATIWNAVSVSLIGYISDHHLLKGGKRLPYMKASILPMAVTLVLFFTATHGSVLFMSIYYTMMMALLMTFHAFFVVPYEALGGDLTVNADERTALRSYARFFMGVGNLVGVVFVLPAVESLETVGFSASQSWQAIIFFIALLGAVSQVITCTIFSGKMQKPKKEAGSSRKQGLIREYLDVLKLKPFLCLLASSIFVSLANVFCNSSIVYFMKYNMGISEYSKAFILGIMTAVGMILTPILAALAKRFDKKIIMGCCYMATGTGFVLFKIGGIQSIFILSLYIIIFTIGTSAYWQLIYAMVYDVGELDEYKNNRSRGAILLSMSKIILRISNACGAQLLALVLFCFGYDQNASVQSTSALSGIEYSLTLLPAILFFCAAICVKRYPLTREKHDQIVCELKKRNN